MNIESLALVFSGAVLHALWNLFAKKASGGLLFVWLFGVVSLCFGLPFGLVFWQDNAAQLTPMAWLAIVASALVHLVYMLVLQKGYRTGDFSIVYPLARGTGPLFSVLGAIILLGETPTLQGWVGVLSIFAGIFLVSGLARPAGAATNKLSAGVSWGILTGFTIATYTIIDAWAVKLIGIAPVLYYVLSLALRTCMLAPIALRDREALRTQWQRNTYNIVAVGILSPLGYTLILYAMTLAPLSYVAPIRELSMLLGVLVGAHLLRESLTPQRIIGSICMICGVTLLASAG